VKFGDPCQVAGVALWGEQPLLAPPQVDEGRATADGQIRNCLFARDENDLRTPLRTGANDDHLASIWRRAVAAKLPGHGINDPGFLQPARPMSAIGG
jgi:cyclic pyranopterin phosphate synthase